jgi:putative ABC transport system permease protein
MIQILSETMTLGVTAGLAGLALAAALLRILPASIPLLGQDRPSITPAAVLLTIGVVLATTVLSALPSCWHVWRSDFSAALHSTSRSTTADRASNRTRSALVACEVALSVTLLAGAGVMLHSLVRLMSVPLGFNPSHLLTARVSAPPQIESAGQFVNYFNRVLEEVDSIPGTRSSAIVTVLPLSNLILTTSFSVDGHKEDWQTYSVRLRSVSPGYFRTMGVRLLKGRFFNPRDTEKAPGVAIVNDVLARHYWPSQDPIGKRISRDSKNFLTVVGVIESARDNLRELPSGELYRPYTQDITAARATSIVVRTQGDPLEIAPVLQQRIHAINHDQPVTEVKTMDEWVSEATAQPRFHTILLELFAGLAFALAIGGVFAVVSYAVTQRTNEIGIRSALGATRQHIASFVLAIGFRPVLTGSLLGVAGALVATRALRSQLFETAPLDPIVFATVIPLLLGAAVIACLIPARRATRIDPSTTLRAE